MRKICYVFCLLFFSLFLNIEIINLLCYYCNREIDLLIKDKNIVIVIKFKTNKNYKLGEKYVFINISYR